MLLSLCLIFMVGMSLGWIMKKLHLPSLLGMVIAGILLGPHVFNLLDTSVLNISAELREIALIIILSRAGLSLNLEDLKKVGRPALLMCFVPACFEILGMILMAPRILGIDVLEAALLGSVVAAVSPAVVVPHMLKVMDHKYGTAQGIPQLILAGASVDDVFVIVIFYSLLSIASGGQSHALDFIQIPTSILLGIGVGWVIGMGLGQFFNHFESRDTAKAIVFLSMGFLLTTIEAWLPIDFSSLIAIMAMGISLFRYQPNTAKTLSAKFNQLWVGAEVVLFVLVGASVNIEYAASAGPKAILLLFIVLLFRMIGVLMCMVKTPFSWKERFFCMFAYMPKATVQAAIGGIPLSMGLACGETILTVAVLAILLTAPIGAFLIDLTYERFLQKDTTSE